MKRGVPFKLFIAFALAVVFGLAAFFSGYLASQYATNRSPASIPRVYDFSHLSGSDLLAAAKERLLQPAKISGQGALQGLQLGHFLVKNKDGLIVEACEVYDKIELEFVAVGMAVNGEPPRMIVRGPCQASDDDNFIDPVLVDARKILAAEPEDQDFDLSEDGSGELTFTNVSDSWPREWILNSIRLYNKSGKEIRADSSDIKRHVGKNLTIDWTQ